ncbi:MAG: hypothetical protein NTNFB01_30590 [Nitrospira sp.]
MQNRLPHPQATLAVILGASEFPKSHLSPSPAFRQSAERFHEYLTTKDKFNLPNSNLLDLFDNPSAATDLDEQVGSFLNERIDAQRDGDFPVSDLIIYYVGHGGFSDDGSQYFLALRDTRSRNKLWSSYAIKALAKTLKEHARDIRKYLILDCCFAASAYEAFQAGPISVAVQQTVQEFPAKGTALLCASGPKNPAMTLPKEKYTMFSGALLDLLEKGAAKESDTFSLANAADLTCHLIRERYKDEAVRPEVHVPDQSVGSVAALPLFPNQALKPIAIEVRLRETEDSVRVIQQKQAILQVNLSALGETVEKLATRLEATRTADVIAPNLKFESAGEAWDFRKEHRGLSRDKWNMIPLEIKAAIRTMMRAKKVGAIWLTLVGAIGLIVVLAAYDMTGFVSPLFFPFLTLQAGMLVVSVLSLTRDLFAPVVSSPIEYRDNRIGEAAHFDVVLECQDFKSVCLMPGLIIDRSMATIAILIEVITLTLGYIRYFPPGFRL